MAVPASTVIARARCRSSFEPSLIIFLAKANNMHDPTRTRRYADTVSIPSQLSIISRPVTVINNAVADNISIANDISLRTAPPSFIFLANLPIRTINPTMVSVAATATAINGAAIMNVNPIITRLPINASILVAICLRVLEAPLMSALLSATIEYICTSLPTTSDSTSTVIIDNVTIGAARPMTETPPTITSRLVAICLRAPDAPIISSLLSATIEYICKSLPTTHVNGIIVASDNSTSGTAMLISETLPTMASRLNAICVRALEESMMSSLLSATIEYILMSPLITILNANIVTDDNITSGATRLISETHPTMASRLDAIHEMDPAAVLILFSLPAIRSMPATNVSTSPGFFPPCPNKTNAPSFNIGHVSAINVSTFAISLIDPPNDFITSRKESMDD